MVKYTQHTLDNGLTLLLHEDRSTPLVALNMLCKVGARNEHPNQTGMAHLLEHLMFSGTERYPDYDGTMSSMQGEANAFTNNDFTNYYVSLPAEHLEQALDMELDRLTNLSLSPAALEVQRHVVTEEYKQRYLGQPYGDAWLLLRPMCYRQHPYRWATIGADINHVLNARLQDVQQFYNSHYGAQNAILAVCGNFGGMTAQQIAAKAAGACRATAALPAPPPVAEEPQQRRRSRTVTRDVPADTIYMAFHMGPRLSTDYYACDLMTDLLASGNSSRLHDHLVRRAALLSEANAYITADLDPGLLVVTGRLADGVTAPQAEAALTAELRRLASEPVPDHELQKVLNRYESNFEFSHYKAADRAYALCYYALLGHPEWVNTEPDNYRRITPATLQATARRLFRARNCNVLYYNMKKQPNQQ